jgi:hypothetical protein
MGRNVNNKIKHGQKLWQPSLFALLNDLRDISGQKVQVDMGSKLVIQHMLKIRSFLYFVDFGLSSANHTAQTA